MKNQRENSNFETSEEKKKKKGREKDFIFQNRFSLFPLPDNGSFFKSYYPSLEYLHVIMLLYDRECG